MRFVFIAPYFGLAFLAKVVHWLVKWAGQVMVIYMEDTSVLNRGKCNTYTIALHAMSYPYIHDTRDRIVVTHSLQR